MITDLRMVCKQSEDYIRIDDDSCKILYHVYKQITINSYRILYVLYPSMVHACTSYHNSETLSVPVDCSAKQNESMKLMMVGFQKMGKTTILGRLCESHERVTPSTTFLQRITGEEATPPTRSKGKRTGQHIPLSVLALIN